MNIPLNDGLELAFASVCDPGLRLSTRVSARDILRRELSLRIWCEERHWTVGKLMASVPIYVVLDELDRKVCSGKSAAEAIETAKSIAESKKGEVQE